MTTASSPQHSFGGGFRDLLDSPDAACNSLEEEEEEDAPLSWRMDPDVSHSDWTIELSHHGDNDDDNDDKSKRTITTYHVHKTILSVGPCKSDYFARLFQNQLMKEATMSTSRIAMEQPSATKAFPCMLDFFYSSRAEITTDNAVALRYLSQYFGVRKLFGLATSFICNSLNGKTAAQYLMDAALYYDDKLITKAAETCARNLTDIDRHVLASMDSKLFLLVLSSCPSELRCTHEELSCIVAEFCQLHESELDGNLLQQITNDMPVVDKEASLSLLKLAVALEQGGEDERHHDEESSRSLTRLRERCIDACSKSWRETLLHQFQQHRSSSTTTRQRVQHNETSTTTSPYSNIPESVKVQLLEKALVGADQQLTSSEEMNSVLGQKCDSLKQRLEVLKQNRDVFGQELKETFFIACPKNNKHKARMYQTTTRFHCNACREYVRNGQAMLFCGSCGWKVCLDCGKKMTPFSRLTANK